MALFPAYSDKLGESSIEKDSKESWLQNSSFTVNVANIPKTSPKDLSEVESESINVKPRKRKRRSEKKTTHDNVKEPNAEEFFAIDHTRNKEFLSVTTISRPAVPKYRIKYRLFYSKQKRRKIKRYFHLAKVTDCDNNINEEESTTDNTNALKCATPLENSLEDFSCFKHEEDLAKTTACFNQSLAENPNDVHMWLRYVQFQDTVYQFEKTFRKGSIAKGLRVTAERKLAILDKALVHNPDCHNLLRERLNIAVSVFPADELQVQIKGLVDKDPSNIILWQGYIEATQCSMSHCNTDSVLSLYKQCLGTLHKLRRTSLKSSLEESILRMLYQCGLFFKQAGLWEQLWTLLKSYLDLNLSPLGGNIFDIGSNFNENHLHELEEVVFKSELPLHELWLRTEKLRESCHWLPIPSDSESEDPQRIVFTEDVAELIHPITLPENTFKLIATILTLLKIPLLPCRHTTMSDLGLDYVPWSLDSIESLLAMFLPLYHINSLDQHLLRDNKLAVGPQYLKILPGQEEYLEFILRIAKKCCDCSQNTDKLSALAWWFRFQRLLIVLDKSQRLCLSEKLKKKMRSEMKGVLKDDSLKQNLQLYCEFALVEKELHGVENAVNIISTVLTVNQETNISPNPNSSQIAVCHTYRTLIELLLSSDTYTEAESKTALKYLVNYVTGKGFVSSQVLTQGSLSEASLIFKHVLLQQFENMTVVTPVQQFLPIFFVDWVICNCWFIYLHKGFLECGMFLENTLEKLERNERNNDSTFQREVLYEFYIALSFKHILKNPGCGMFKILDDILQRGIQQYPNNMFMLSILSKEQSINTTLGPGWWKIKNMLLGTKRAFPAIFLVLILLEKISTFVRNMEDSITGEKCGTPCGLKNKVLSLYKRITRSDMPTRRCGLIWRLYLQFVYEHFDPSVCRSVYYQAVEECPWLKALYIDAAIYIPAELSQIQDLIIEKQLRIHITPEELDILRS